MREQKFGIEIELTGLTRQKAAEVISKYLGNSYQYDGGYYEEYSVYDNQGRKWKVMYDSSIVAKKKDGTHAGDEYKVEFVSPICEYADIPTIQEIVRQLRHAGAIAGEKCGIHVHVNAAPHNAKTLRNITNIMYSKEDLIYKAFAPNSESAEVLSKSLGNKTVMSGSISRGKNDPSQSLQMIQRPLMTPDELKSLPKGNFIVSKTGSHPMRTKLKLFLKWGITFEEPYEIEEKSARKVAYADKQEIEEEIIRRYMCCVDEEPESTEQGTASRSGGMLQSQMNETVAKVRQTLRTED